MHFELYVKLACHHYNHNTYASSTVCILVLQYQDEQIQQTKYSDKSLQ